MVKKSLAFNILEYFQNVTYDEPLPEGIKLLNPFRENETIRKIAASFYDKFYDDFEPRQLILGINPGRLGAGATGIPFTDSKRLTEHCGLQPPDFSTYEPSSVFIYEMIEAFGGVMSFYKRFYINSVFPLGLVKKVSENKYVNYNYYDDVLLQKNLTPYIVDHISHQLTMCKNTTTIYCLGRGKNFLFLHKLNEHYSFAKKIIPLEHPRYIMQYKSKLKEQYIHQYLEAFQMHR